MTVNGVTLSECCQLRLETTKTCEAFGRRGSIQANIRLRLLVCDGRGVEDVWRVAQLVEPQINNLEGHGFESRLAVRLIFYYVALSHAKLSVDRYTD